MPSPQRRIVNKVGDVVTLAQYRLEQLKYYRKRPLLTDVGRRIVADLKREGVAVTSLDELGFASNPALRSAIGRCVADLDASREAGPHEYESGFEHCVPINPTRIAEEYPDLYLWGLDEGLLDLIEGYLGLPAAYHGVCARKEVVDGKFTGTRVWHRDLEDLDITRVIVYLSDVEDESAGPFEYVPRGESPSYRAFKGLDGTAIRDPEMEAVVPRSKWKRCMGPAGTVIIGAVARVFHHGMLPQKARKAISYYYTSRNPSDEELCLEYSFRKGIPLIRGKLNQRQLDCLWKYRPMLAGGLG